MCLLQRSSNIILLLLATSITTFAYFDTEGAQVIFYFPQLADGGGVPFEPDRDHAL